jgi:hypothetical protein
LNQRSHPWHSGYPGVERMAWPDNLAGSVPFWSDRRGG